MRSLISLLAPFTLVVTSAAPNEDKSIALANLAVVTAALVNAGKVRYVWVSLVPLAFVVAGYRWGQPDGQVMFFFILSMAAAEVSVGLALVLLPVLAAGILHRIDNLDRVFAERYKQVWPLRRHTSKRILPFLY